jgi:hypothetical protein
MHEEGHMSLRFVLLATGAAALVAGCASATTGTGSVRTTSAPASTPASTSSSPSLSVPTTSSPPTGSSSAAAGCTTGDYCDDFSSASTGWPVENTAHYFANYAEDLGGSYRMGERSDNAKTQLAPVDITTISKNYGVQVDVDAVLGKAAPASSFIGIVCWDHTTATDSEAGFLFFVTADSVDVTLLPDTGSKPRTLTGNQGGSFVKPYPATNHLTATCVQRTTSAGVEADLSLVVNGAAVLQEQYAKSVKNYPWSPGSRTGLLVAGPKSDVFYDNFSLTGT